MGIVTNLIGGWVGARSGLNRTLLVGLGLQIVALVGLTFHDPSWVEWARWRSSWVLQALSGVAKDLTKMSSKSAVKFVAGEGALFRLVAILTGSKNALKGVGFFLGAALLSWIGYDAALWSMAALIAVALVAVGLLLDEDIGRAKVKPKLRSILSKSTAINRLSAARFFLFGSRDIWFVVALPVFLDRRARLVHTDRSADSSPPGSSATASSSRSHLASATLARERRRRDRRRSRLGVRARLVSAAMAVGVALDVAVTAVVVGGLIVFGVVFALNSSLHSYLILAYCDGDDVSLDVGFYYSANAAGRLVGTLLSGVLYLWGGLEAALWGSAAFVAITWLLTLRLPALTPSDDQSAVTSIAR